MLYNIILPDPFTIFHCDMGLCDCVTVTCHITVSSNPSFPK